MDRPDEFDVPSAPDGGGPDGPSRSAVGRRVAVEERDRFEYYDALRLAACDHRVSEATPRVESRAEARLVPGDGWAEAADRFRSRWAEHLERWPDRERDPVDRSGDPEGSWRGDSGRFLDRAANAEVEERYGQIADAERTVLTPAMREIEACDPERRLVGFEHRLKGLDRLKDKVAAQMDAQPELSGAQAMTTVKDAVRFTFQYADDRYTTGVQADIGRLKESGFEQLELRNSWADAFYRGINSRWRELGTGLVFEVQFHTHASFEAKQLTHITYERIRDPRTSREEQRELEVIQRAAAEKVSPPSGAADLPNYPQGRLCQQISRIMQLRMSLAARNSREAFCVVSRMLGGRTTKPSRGT